MKKKVKKEILSEFLGTFLLLTAVVGSGLMATKLTEDRSLQLLINALATSLMLVVIISSVAPLSSAHFNPAVTMLETLRGSLSISKASVRIAAQLLGAIAGTLVANLMFEKNNLRFSTTDRLTLATFLGELIATSGLLSVLILRPKKAHYLVPAWIASAYFFTSSTSFANPAATFGRVFTDSFSGISPRSSIGFVGAELISVLCVYCILRFGFESDKK